MKKFLIIFVIIAVVVSSIFVLVYNSPDVFIGISKPVDANAPMYVQSVVVGGNGRLNLPVPEYIKDRLNEIYTKAHATETEIYEKFETAHIEIEIVIESGKTIVHYSGAGVNKETNATEEYNKELVFDFVATKNIIGE